jgi:hypothetical protein
MSYIKCSWPLFYNEVGVDRTLQMNRTLELQFIYFSCGKHKEENVGTNDHFLVEMASFTPYKAK